MTTVNQGNEDIGGNPIQITDKSDDTVISPENSTLSKIYGDTFTLELDGGDTDETPTFVSSNPDIATVDENGNVTIVGVGEVVITVTRPGNGAYKSESQEITVTVGKKELSLTAVDILDKYYDGNTDAEIDPDSVVINGIVKGDEDKFDEYLISSASFPDSKAGTYTDASATFTLTDELAEKYFFKQNDSSQKDSVTLIDDAIIISKPINTPAEGDNDGYTISVAPIKDYSWTGKEITPPLVVKDGEKLLVEGVDYTVVYKNNIAVGTADVIINGLGNYQGTLNTEFKIVPINIDLDGDGKPDIN
ncbi:MAG: Ig-like domain-containing protein, partial [Eubacterium sp.]|nr:Ig-like domain-containing protein [Eubacterium sp.]